MANIWEKAISILAGNLNLGCSYLITTVSFYNRLVWQGKRGSKLRGSSQLHTVAKFTKFHPKSWKDIFPFWPDSWSENKWSISRIRNWNSAKVVWVNREKQFKQVRDWISFQLLDCFEDNRSLCSYQPPTTKQCWRSM